MNEYTLIEIYFLAHLHPSAVSAFAAALEAISMSSAVT